MTEVLKRIPPIYLWLHGLVSAFIAGSSTAFVAVAGGTTVVAGAGDAEPLTGKQLLVCSLMGGLINAGSYLKKRPLPELVNSTTLEKQEPPI